MKKQDKQFIALATALMIGLLILIAVLFRCAIKEEELTPEPYTVCYGDSLDKLYYEFGGGNLEKWRYEVKKLNDMEESGLYEGDEIVILVSKEE